MFRILNLSTGEYLQWEYYRSTKEILDSKMLFKKPKLVPTEFCTEEVAELYLEKYCYDHVYTKSFTIGEDTNVYYKQVKPSISLFQIIEVVEEALGGPLSQTPTVNTSSS